MEALQVVGVSLSAVGAIALALLWRDLWRRSDMPGLEHGSVRVSGNGMKRFWAGVFLLAFIAGGPSAVTLTRVDMPRGNESRAIAGSPFQAVPSVSW
jgi:hypothetical protein